LGNLKGRHHLIDLGMNGEDIIRMDFREIAVEGVDWIHLALRRDQWRTLVNTAMNLRIS
jgi:hypothetical protein